MAIVMPDLNQVGLGYGVGCPELKQVSEIIESVFFV
jgi:hypothetical protein